MAVADALRCQRGDVQITALGTARGLETTLVPERGYPLELIPPVPLPRSVNADLLRLPTRVWSSVRVTRGVLDAVAADVVVGFGGYVALPAYLAARRRGVSGRVPTVVHEANARAGLANKVGARGAARILAAVADCGLAGAQVVGMPVRQSITTLDRAGLRSQARAHFGLDQQTPVLLVFGGSQGASSLNAAVSGAAGGLGAAGIGVLHAHGPRNTVVVPNVPGAPAYVAVPYLSRMDLAYAAADVVVCRAGAMTVAEVSAVGLPAVYVPLPHGNGEQELNARPVVDAGGGVLLADAELSSASLLARVVGLVADPARLAAMGAAAAGSGHRDAARVIAHIALGLAADHRGLR